MLTCESCQAQLLHQLYGLLDEPDGLAITAHLESCAACRSALDKARQQQEILAAAAKTAFPGVNFKAIDQPSPSESTLPLQQPKRRIAWGRWAAAACLVLTLGGAGFAYISWFSLSRAADRAVAESIDAQRQRDKFVEEQLAELQPLQADIAKIQEKIALAVNQYREQVARVQREYESKPVQFTVIHPKTLQAGGPNQLIIEAKRKDGAVKGQDYKMVAFVVDDRTKAEVARTALKEGRNDFVLPASLLLKPGTQLNLRVLATEAGKNDETLIDEMLPLVTSLYVTHLTTDRPMYRPGEVVHFRSLTLERFSLKPADEVFEVRFRLVRMISGQEQEVVVLEPGTGQPAQLIGTTRLKDASGQMLLGPDGKEIRGIGAGSFELPGDLPGGEYTLVVSETHDGFPAERRKLLVNRYQAPRLEKDVDFTRKSYGPGDIVTASCKVAPVEGGRVLAEQPVTAFAEVDGVRCEMLTAASLKTDGLGQCTLQFRLPAKIERGEAILSVTFTDGANVETTVEPIPIVLNKLKIDFYPEGGELVASAVNRVYFCVRTLLNKPAELRGHIVDRDGNTVARLQTFSDDKEVGVNQGMGRFDFTPQPGQRYELKIDSPAGIEGTFWLPPVQTSGVMLHLPQGVVGDKIDLVLHSAGKARKLLVGAYCRGQLLDHRTTAVLLGKPQTLTLKPAADVGGVYRVTVFEVSEDDGVSLRPVAERLLYRRSTEKLNLQVFTDKKTYTPGDRVTLSLTATDEHNKSAPAIVLVSVVDKSVLKLRNDRTARAMPTHFLLTSEVRGPEDLEYADVLLREDEPKALEALDLLLGTQGWRRFIEQKLPADQIKGLVGFKDDANRLLAISGQAPQQKVQSNLIDQLMVKVGIEFAAKHKTLASELSAKEVTLVSKLEAGRKKSEQLQAEIFDKKATASTTKDQLKEFTWWLSRSGPAIVLVCLAILALIQAFTGLAEAKKGRPRAAACFVGGGLCLGALVLGLAILIGGGSERALSVVFLGGTGSPSLDKRKIQEKHVAEEPRGDPLKLRGAALQNKVNGAAAKIRHSPFPPDAAKFEMNANARPVPEAAGKLALGRGNEANMNFRLKEEALFFRPQLPPLPGQNQKRFDYEPRIAEAKEQAALALATPNAFILREYAHQHATSPDNVRRDFAETVYWHPALVLPGDKALDVSFDLSDAVTQFQVQVWGHTQDGRLGALTKDIASRLPFSLDAKLPIEISSTDKIAIPVALTNDTEKNRHVTLKVEADNLKLLGNAEYVLPLAPNTRLRKMLHFLPGAVQAEAKVRLMGISEPFGSDSIERTFKIVPEGFPVTGKESGLLKAVEHHTIQLPAKREQWVPGTLKLQTQVFPSTLADLQKGLEALLRQPGGCFEQTSSSNYPNVMILDYLKESDQINPQLEKRARDLLASGYAKLTAFECIDPKTTAKKEGYEWFGQTAPPHEALTAYGLLQFLDMAKYQHVDPAMLERTKKYLLSQRNGKGGFSRNQRALDSFGRAPDHITDAYIVWALCEAEVKEDISRELNAVVAKANATEDPYLLALASLGLMKRGQSSAAVPLLKKLQAKQKADGSLTASETSITHSGGTQLSVETTSLAVLAWLRANQPQQFGEAVRQGADWIGKQRGAFGGYGSTQSTVLALKALIAYTRENKMTAEAGELRLYVNGRALPAALKAFPAGTLEPIVVELRDEHLLQPGENAVGVEITGKNAFPYTVTWSYMALTPANHDACPVRLTTKLAAAQATEGQALRMTAVLENVSGQEQGMAVAIVGLPGGCALPADLQELRNLVRAGKIDAFEVRGRELVLYWRGLAKDAKHEVNVSVICQVPGQYRGPASRAYLYYNTDERWWVEPLAVDIGAKAE